MTSQAQQDLNAKLCDAAAEGKQDLVTYYLQQGAQLDGRHCENGCRDTPLMKAVQAGQADMVAFLLHAGANAELRNSENKSAVEMSPNLAITALLENGGKEDIDRVVFFTKIGDRTREDVYDFTMLERVTLIRQSRFGAVDSTVIAGFSAIEDKSDGSALRAAFNEHRRRGGKTDESVVFPFARLVKNKIPTNKQ